MNSATGFSLSFELLRLNVYIHFAFKKDILRSVTH